jgi:hypothetical protein
MQDNANIGEVKLPWPLETWVKISSGEIGTIDDVARIQNEFIYEVIVGRCFRFGVRHKDIEALDSGSAEINPLNPKSSNATSP